MAELTMCKDTNCPQRGQCLRYLAHPTGRQDRDGTWRTVQLYFSTSPRPANLRKKCPKFWDMSTAPAAEVRDQTWADSNNG